MQGTCITCGKAILRRTDVYCDDCQPVYPGRNIWTHPLDGEMCYTHMEEMQDHDCPLTD